MAARPLAWSIVVILLAALAAPRAPAQPAEGGRIGEIRVEGEQRVDPATVRSYLTVVTGDRFDPGALDESLKSLFATGLFEDVALEREDDTLVVRVEENPIINRIAFEGNLRIDDEELGREIDLRPRVVYTPARVQSAVGRILEIYRRSGRYAATVEPKIIELEQNRVDLVFEIQEGPRTTVRSISFVGNEAFSDARLRGEIETVESRFWRVLATGDTYDPDRLAFDQELLRRFYVSEGYADFEVRSAIAELTPEGDGFFITFTVAEGPRYRFGEVDVESRIPDLEPAALEALIGTETGDVYDAEAIEDTVTAMTERLGELGYAFVDIDPRLARDRAEQTIGVTYEVDEGPRVYVERIEITNNVRTLDRVIRREMRLAEGDAFNTVLLRESERRIRRLGFFEEVNVSTREGSAPDRIIVEVEVSERATGELAFGAGFSTTDGPLAAVNLSERNLLGTGRELRAEAAVSGRRQDVDVSYTEPYAFGYEIDAGFDVFDTQTDFQDESSFDEENLGLSLRAGYPLTRDIRHSVRYTIRRDEISDIGDDASVFIQQEEGDALTSAFGQSFSIDTRDDVLLPGSGYAVRLDQEIAGLGGDRHFLSHELSSAYFQPVVEEPDVVLRLGLDAGYVFGLGEDVTLANRFFIGGNNFRGFSVSGIGPRDRDSDDALGGNAYYVGSAEVRFPLGLPEELRLFGRGFVDAGTLTEIDVSGPDLADSGNLRLTAGVGFTWLSPFGPLDIDFGQALVKDDVDETELFRFSFGTRF
ncbi:MAG: outer membrane protein assembly factor BamA [Alphaproteobacteria bacterium]